VARIAEEPDVLADVVVSGAAGFAVIAVEGRFERRAISRRPTSHSSAGLDHRAGWFVTQHHGILAGSVADGAFAVSVKVGTADADGLYADLNLSRGGIFGGLVEQAERMGSSEFGNKHLRPIVK
jgi:hypothetical protein